MKQNIERNKDIHRTRKPVFSGRSGGHMEAVHFGDTPKPIDLIFLHANGFTGLSYRSILEPLALETGTHIVALNLRGHGGTDLPTDDVRRASHISYGKDFAAYLRAHIDGSVVVAGHSLGANTAILAAGMAPNKIAKVLAFDPIVLPIGPRFVMSSAVGRSYLMKNFGIAKNAGRRRDKFASHQDVFKRYHGRGPFKHFPEEVLKDYIHDAFVAHDDSSHDDSSHDEAGSVRLACRPKWEQLGYVTQSHHMKRRIVALPSGSRVIITDFVKQSENWMQRARRKNTGLRIDYYPDKDHFFPLTEPEISLSALKDILAK